MTATVQAQPDERIAKSRLLDRLVIRPEIGALLGAALVFVFFSIFTDQFLSPSGVARMKVRFMTGSEKNTQSRM